MVLLIQVFGALFGLFMLYYSFIHFKRKEFTIQEFILWLVVWVAFITVALQPTILDGIVHTFSFARRLDVLVISAFIFLTAISFYTYSAVKKMQNKMEEIVRQVALKEEKK